MTTTVPCPTCQTAVSLPASIRRGGLYVSCEACRGTFLVIDEESLPEGDLIEFSPEGAVSAGGPARFAGGVLAGTEPPAVDDSLRSLATGSLFLGGVSLALLCIPAFAVLSSVCGLVLGLVSLNTTERRRAVVGILFNAAALVIAIGLFLQALQVVLQQQG